MVVNRVRNRPLTEFERGRGCAGNTGDNGRLVVLQAGGNLIDILIDPVVGKFERTGTQPIAHLVNTMANRASDLRRLPAERVHDQRENDCNHEQTHQNGEQRREASVQAQVFESPAQGQKDGGGNQCGEYHSEQQLQAQHDQHAAGNGSCNQQEPPRPFAGDFDLYRNRAGFHRVSLPQ